MKKMKRADRIEKKKRRTTILIGLFVVAVMVVGMFFVPFGQDEQEGPSLEYNGYKFSPTNQRYWAVEVNEQAFFFTYLPEQLENITVSEQYTFQRDKIYLVWNDSEIRDVSSAWMSASQLSNDRPVQDATLDPKDTRDIPVITCKDDKDIIVIKQGENKAYREGNCLIIQGEDYNERIKVSERILYRSIGVMS